MHVAQASIRLVQFEPNNRANGMWIMSSNFTLNTDPSPSTVYQIRIKGHLDGRWRDWFEGLTITLEDNGDTLLTGPVVDQAALYGLLRKVRDLGIPLLSVICIKPGQADTSDVTLGISKTKA